MSSASQSIAEEILALVRVPSVTGNETILAGVLEARLRGGPAGRTHQVLRVDDTLVMVPAAVSHLLEAAEPPSPPAPGLFRVAGRPLIVLAGHIDTVPQGEAPPPAVREGRVIGRGACDMKAGVAAMLQLVETLDPASGFAHRVFIFYSGEEGPAITNGLRRLLDEQAWLQRTGLAVLLEPTSGDLELGCSGSMHLAVTFHGKACHSARPWTGEHPLRHALPWLTAILARPVREAEVAGVVFREVAVPTRLRAGEARNVVPATLEVNLNLRYPPDRTPVEAEELARSLFPEETVFRRFGRRRSASGPRLFEEDPADTTEANLERAAPSPTASDGSCGSLSPGESALDGPPPGAVTVVLADHSPAGRISLEAPLYRHLLQTTGLPRRAKQGWTDVARFTAFGVPALNWGPGDPGFAHTKHEFVDIDQVERFVARLRGYLLGGGPQE